MSISHDAILPAAAAPSETRQMVRAGLPPALIVEQRLH